VIWRGVMRVMRVMADRWLDARKRREAMTEIFSGLII
jgi:hypothetical protein